MADKETKKEAARDAKAVDPKTQAVPFNTEIEPGEKAPKGAEAVLVQEDPTINAPADADIIEPAVEDQVPTDPSPPEDGRSMASRIPASIGGPVSPVALPNAHRDATALAIEQGVIPVARNVVVEDGDVDAGPRGAYELAKLIEAHPDWLNNLDQLDELERAAGLEPRPWVTDPQLLLEEAIRYNFYFIGANGNQLPGLR